MLSLGAFAPRVVRSVLPFGDESVSRRVWTAEGTDEVICSIPARPCEPVPLEAG
jgi:hypothetical protein